MNEVPLFAVYYLVIIHKNNNCHKPTFCAVLPVHFQLKTSFVSFLDLCNKGHDEFQGQIWHADETLWPLSIRIYTLSKGLG